MSTFRERVQKSAQDYNTWTPEKGDILIGKFLGVRDIKTKFGEAQIAGIEEDDTKAVISVFLSTVLANQFISQKIVVGETVGISYLGKEKNYKNYSVLVDRPETPTEIKPRAGAAKPKKKKGKGGPSNED